MDELSHDDDDDLLGCFAVFLQAIFKLFWGDDYYF